MVTLTENIKAKNNELSKDSIKGMKDNDIRLILESMFETIEDLEKRLSKLEK